VPKKRTPEIVADVSGRMKQSPKKSPLRLAQEMDLSYGTGHKILKIFKSSFIKLRSFKNKILSVAFESSTFLI
jgi:hypothetical protein